jgi:hypothetical protein
LPAVLLLRLLPAVVVVAATAAVLSRPYLPHLPAVVPNVVVVAVVPNGAVVARLLLLRLQGRTEASQESVDSQKAKGNKEVRQLLDKGQNYITQWEICDQMVITTDKDKAYFQNITNLSNCMQAKLEGDTGTLIDQELSNELRVTIQHVSLVVSSTKAYKQWAKKPDDVAYLAERARLDDFADQRPEISFCGSRLHLIGRDRDRD